MEILEKRDVYNIVFRKGQTNLRENTNSDLDNSNSLSNRLLLI